MLQDANDVDDGAVLETDLCVAGAGAAGITLALQFLGSGTDVVLLEGGGEARSSESQRLYVGTCEEPIPDNYLIASRLRLLGGTTNHWIGACLPLDPIDMEARDWVPDSGWPFDRSELDAFYARAIDVVGIRSFYFGEDLPLYDGSSVVLKHGRVKPTRFGHRYREPLAAAPNLRLLLHANVVRVGLRENGESVERLDVATAAGRRFSVRARRFVLALGGIENSRMLLVSDDVHSTGVGNRQDQVGRYWMGHPSFLIAEVCISDRDRTFNEYRPQGGCTFRLSEAVQRRHRLLNCGLSLSKVPPVEDHRHERLSGGVWARLKPYLEKRGFPRSSTVDRLVRHAGDEDRLHYRRFKIRPEAPPSAENRVMLSSRQDPFGNRRVHLRWTLSPEVYRTARRTGEIFAHDLGRRGLGRVALDLEGLEEADYSPGFHHLGGTRMHDDPRRGVVDRDGRVHGVDNLYLVGSSVFPAGGYANPTFTIVALTLRLADHLGQVLGRPA